MIGLRQLLGAAQSKHMHFYSRRRRRSSSLSVEPVKPVNDEVTPEKFGISETFGFLYPKPLEFLQGPFAIWTDAAHCLDNLVAEHRLRDVVDQWPLLNVKELRREEERYLAQSVLSNIACAYIWQEGEADPATRIPAQLSVPLCYLSGKLGVQPTVSVLSIILTNWRLRDPLKPPDLRNIELIHPLPGGDKTKWFAIVSIHNEIVAAPGIKYIVEAIRSVVAKDDYRLTQCLKMIQGCIKKLAVNVLRMFDHLEPNDFYTLLRPFFAGYGGPGSFIKEGVVFEGVSEVPKKVTNASAAQSSTIQCFDAALRIEHEPERRAFHLAMRHTMPPRHRYFIEAIEQAPNIREYVEQSSSPDLVTAYNRAVSQLTDFRRVHIHVVKRFVVDMKRKKGVTSDYGSVATKVFNGSDTVDYLKGFVNATKDRRLWTLDNEREYGYQALP